MKIGTHLFTRDGRGIGNAIVVGFAGDAVKIKTDFGNYATLTLAEIYGLFHVTDREGNERVSDVERWTNDRSDLAQFGDVLDPQKQDAPKDALILRIETLTEKKFDDLMRQLAAVIADKNQDADAVWTVADFFYWLDAILPHPECRIEIDEAAALLIALSGVFQEYLERSHGISFSPN